MHAEYKPCKVLVIYGLGGADRHTVGMDHVRNGRPLLSFDLGYWDRKLPHRKYRFSLNGLHPSQVMESPYLGAGRFLRSGLKIQAVTHPKKGPVMLVGNAPKSIAAGAGNWTAKKSQELATLFPDQEIIYRPKPKRPAEQGVKCHRVSTGDLSSELRNCSLVVCRHSNVAVDACLLGVPVVCSDGAAAAIYPSKLEDYRNQPDLKTRTEFLHKLAHWQWGTNETELFWQWLFVAFPALRY